MGMYLLVQLALFKLSLKLVPAVGWCNINQTKLKQNKTTQFNINDSKKCHYEIYFFEWKIIYIP